MVLAGWALLAVGAVAQVLREVQPNASLLIVESLPAAQEVVVVLTAGSQGMDDAPATYGWRHLLEHLAARGTDGGLDRRIEAAGMFLIPATLRDVSRFEIRARPSDLPRALEFLSEAVGPLQAGPEAMAFERRVLREEFALVPPSAWSVAKAWRQAYGERRLDPFGHPDTLAGADVASLDRLRTALFTAEKLTLSIVGPGSTAELAALGRAWLAQAPPPAFEPFAPPTTEGEVVLPALPAGPPAAFLRVGAWDEPRTSAVLGAALALADRAPDLEVVYTPAFREGLVAIVAPLGADLSEVLRLPADEVGYRAEQARVSLPGWLAFQMSGASRRAQFRGLLGTLTRRGRPEALVEVAARLTRADFAAALGEWSRAEAVR